MTMRGTISVESITRCNSNAIYIVYSGVVVLEPRSVVCSGSSEETLKRTENTCNKTNRQTHKA